MLVGAARRLLAFTTHMGRASSAKPNGRPSGGPLSRLSDLVRGAARASAIAAAVKSERGVETRSLDPVLAKPPREPVKPDAREASRKNE
jgi:hypothetical protein